MSKTTLPAHYPYLDALRGLAIIGIIVSHCRLFGRHNYHHFLDTIARNGTMGVSLFFIVSAFSLALSFSKRSESETRPIRNFFIRRFFRVAPLFYLVTLLYWLFPPLIFSANYPAVGQTSPANLIGNLSLLFWLNPDWINYPVPGQWAVAAEIVFYLIFPFLFRHLSSLSKTAWVSVIAALWSQLIFLLTYKLNIYPGDVWRSYLYYSPPNHLSVFLIGFCLFHLTKSKPSWPSANFAFFLQFFSVLLVSNFILTNILPYHYLFAVGLGLFAYSLSAFPNPLFVNLLTVYLGKISYGLFLCHFIVLQLMLQYRFVDFVDHPEVNFAIRVLLVLLFSAFLATVSYHLVERPSKRLAQKAITYFNR